MPIPVGDEPLIPPLSDLGWQAKAQLRIAVASIGAALVLRHVLPAWAVNNQTVDLAVGGLLYAGMSGWQWARTKLIHRKTVAVARDPRVDPNIARLPAQGDKATV